MTDEKNKGGRPRVIPRVPPEDRLEALAMARAGRPLELIADALGIGRQTLINARHRYAEMRERVDAGEQLSDDEIPEFVFCGALANARAFAAFELHDVVELGGEDWRAKAWLLERFMPDVYGARSKTEITGVDGGPVQVEGRAPAIFIPAKKPDE